MFPTMFPMFPMFYVPKRMSRSEIEQLVTKRLGKDHIKKEGQDELSVDGGIILKFKGDSLVEVKSINEE